MVFIGVYSVFRGAYMVFRGVYGVFRGVLGVVIYGVYVYTYLHVQTERQLRKHGQLRTQNVLFRNIQQPF